MTGCRLAAVALVPCAFAMVACDDASTATPVEVSVEVSNPSIMFAGDSIDVNTAASSAGVEVDGRTVTITAPGTYRLGGTATDSNVVVDAGHKGAVRLVLDGLDLVSAGAAPIAAVSAGAVVVELPDGTTSRLADSSDSDDHSVLSSQARLAIEGGGALDIVANADDAIVSSKSIVLRDASVHIVAVDDAVRGDDGVTVESGSLTIDAGGDGLHSESSVAIDGGDISILDAHEGIEANQVTIRDGTISITAAEDGINAPDGDQEPRLVVAGGTTVIDADGDGIDVNGTVAMTGGSLTINGPTATTNGAIDYDIDFQITGGVLLACGSADMAEAPSASSPQHSLLFRFDTVGAGTLLSVKASDGTQLVTFTTSKATQTLAVSSPEIDALAGYQLFVGADRIASTTAVKD